jgi:hypothetical protein
MRADAIILAGLVAACALEQDSAQPVFRVSGHGKMVYAKGLPAARTVGGLVCGKPSQDACEAVALVQMGSRRKAWAPVPPPRLAGRPTFNRNLAGPGCLGSVLPRRRHSRA